MPRIEGENFLGGVARRSQTVTDIPKMEDYLQGRRTHPEGGWYFGEPKTPKSRCTLPLSESLIRTLRASHPVDFDPEAFIFTALEGGPIISDNLSQRHFKPLLVKAELPTTICLYDLRHMMATLLLVAGVNPKIVSERLGHS